MHRITRGMLVLSLVFILAGCARQTQQQAVDTALDSASSAQSGGVTEEAVTSLPKNMPAEVQLPGGRVDIATEVQDGYQVKYSSGQTPTDVKSYYRTIEGWSVVAEFPTGDAQSISIERPDQRVLITITPQGSGSEVLVTGAEVKEVDANQ